MNNFASVAEVGFTADINQVDILCLAETNVDWQDQRNRIACESHLRPFWKSIKMVTASSGMTHGTAYQPGGVATIIGGDWVGRLSKKEADAHGLGRWTTCTLQGKDNTRLTIITAYQVCNDRIESTGPKTAFRQQYSLLRTVHGDLDPNPRKQFIRDLDSLLRELVDEGHEILLLLDANESLSDRTSGGIRDLTRKHRLADLHTRLHGLDGQPATYIRGKQKIDYIFGSPKVAANTIGAGITPFESSDHRGLFVDIALSMILGGPASSIPAAQHRDLHSSNPKQAIKYRSELIDYFEQHRIEERAATIHAKITRTKECTDEDSQILEAIDCDVSRGMAAAAKKCRQKYRHPWSPIIKKLQQRVTYWKYWLIELRTNKKLYIQRSRILPFIELPLPAPTECPTKPIIQTNLRRAQKDLRQTLKRAPEIRQLFLEERAAAEAEANNSNTAKILKRIKLAEETKSGFNNLRHALGKTKSGALSSIILPDGSRIFDQKQITDKIIKRNFDHFGQAHGTPFTVEPLINCVGWHGTSESSDAILDGTISQDEIATCTEATKDILEALKQNLAPPDSIDVSITVEDLRSGFKSWRESTSTSPSGRHLGHYHSILAYESPPADDDDTPRVSDRILGVLANLIDSAIKTGFVFPRWTKIVNAMLEKIPGQPRLQKLRVIHLLEADLNLSLGILWSRRLMAQGERLNVFGEEQWGSRRGRSATTAVLLKHFTYLMMDLTKTDGATFDNDAKACFDRIIPSLTNLRSRQLGMPRSACQLHADLLLKAAYALKTAAGISEETYSATDTHPLYGEGQGTKWAVTAWVIISTLIMALMPKKSSGIQFQDPQRLLLTKRIMEGFVDDTTLWLNLLRGGTIQEIAARLQVAAQWWEQLLHATGGQLELPKCFYYLLHWKFDSEGHARLATPEELNLQISIRQSADGQEVDITQRSCGESHKALGVHGNPARIQKAEYRHLLDKSDSMAQLLAAQSITRSEAWKAYRSIFMSSMTYSLPASNFTRKELAEIQSNPTRVLLSAMGYNRNMPLAVVFGPSYLGGIGLTHLYVAQGYLKTLTLLAHIRHHGPLGQLMWTALQWTQLTAGVGFELFREPWRFSPHADGNWFSSLRKFLYDSECTLRIENTYTVQVRRIHDRILMDDALVAFGLSTYDIKAINRCRLYLQVECLSDICTADGQRIDPGLQATPPTVPSRSKTEWPRQGIPGPRSWAAWRRFIRSYTRESSSHKLRQLLGPWTRPDLRIWPTYYDTESQMLCQMISPPATEPTNRDATWQYHTAETITTRRFLAVSTSNTPFQDSQPGPDAIPVTVLHETASQIRCSLPPRLKEPATDTAREEVCATFADYVMQLPMWEQDLLKHAKEYIKATPLYELVQQKEIKLLIVSDGGAYEEYGSFGWVLATDTEILWECKGIARGYPMSSYRSEGYGRLSLLLFLQHYFSYLDIQPHVELLITSYCDNESLLSTEEAFHTREVDSSSLYIKPDHDIIMQLSALRAKLPFRLASLHVRGHQDDKLDFKQLCRPAQLNVLADRLATAVLKDLREAEKPMELYPLPACRAYLCDNTGYITSKEKHSIATELADYALRDYLQQHNNWTPKTYESISWKAYRSSTSKINVAARIFVVKHTHDWLPVGIRERRCGAATDTCPQCQQSETMTHLYTCTARTEWRARFITQLKRHLADTSTAADTRLIIVKGIENWLLTGNTNDPDSNDPVDRIGWFGVLKGYIPHQWNISQEAFYRYQKLDAKYNNGEQWTSRLIEFFWTQSRIVWKDRCTAAHATRNDNSENSSNRARQTAVLRMETAYSYGPHMLAHDRRIFDTPLEEQLRMRTHDIKAWTATMLPVINQSIRDAKAQIATGHRDIRSYTTDRTTPSTELNTNATTNLTRETPVTRANPNASTASEPATRAAAAIRTRRRPFSALRNRLQQVRSHLATNPTNATARASSTASIRANTSLIRRRVQQARTQVATLSADIRQFFPGRSNAR